MSIWTTAPQVSRPPKLPPNIQVDQTVTELYSYVKEMANVITSMKNDLEFMINGHLDANNIRANSIETKNLKAGAVTAEKIFVETLSAITANMGKLTSGEIYGAYIASREAAFPRAELNNTGDLLAVYTDADNYLTIEPGITGEPTVTIRKSGAVSLILGPAFGLTGLLASTPIVLGTQNGNTNIVCGDSDDVIIPSWSQFKNTETGTSLQAELDSIRAELAGKADI
ncbi:hypothetical protein [Paenibacillus odorifer]|uniref:hypothetical protein n=1 Tax=Paenibacillus odorifer TaxID=189426 RepID=UPI00096C3128|nr:hypothetical protein [Paenibacillus odorifer]OME12781.1 hypothetical protein BSK60_16900 [Paenibacillus odorifer]